MNIYDIILRLKNAQFKSTEAGRIKREIKELPFSQRREIVSQLRNQKTKSDNSDIIDVINDIINEIDE
jgi:hypothetical protein